MRHLSKLLLIAGTLVLASCAGSDENGSSPIAKRNYGAIDGTLRVHHKNPRYFTNNTGKAIYLTGSHSWTNLPNGSVWFGVNARMDFNTYLNYLKTTNHNFIRLWTADTASDLSVGGYAETTPYVRRGPGSALDGRPKFDLAKLDQAYFDRLRQLVQAARDRGVYVSIMLFNFWGVSGYGNRGPWKGNPYNAANNINGINGDPNGDGRGLETHTGQMPEVTVLQKAYAKKIIDSVNDLDNVLYEISNESDSSAYEWQNGLIDYIHSYESDKPKRHPVGMTGMNQLSNSALYSSSADWISPYDGEFVGDSNQRYSKDPPAGDGRKVIIVDTDHLTNNIQNPMGYGVATHVWVWKSLTRGLNPIYMDALSSLTGYTRPDWDESGAPGVRLAQGHGLSYASRINLVAMVPSGDVSSTGYALADPGSEYLVYQPNDGAFTVNVQAGTYTVEWLNPSNGEVSGGGARSIPEGRRVFNPPFDGDSVLYLGR